MTMQTDSLGVVSGSFLQAILDGEPMEVRAHTYLAQDDTGAAHVHGWVDVVRSVSKNSQQVNYDQVAHHHLHEETCVRQCLLFKGTGRCGT